MAVKDRADSPPIHVLQEFGCEPNQLRRLPGGQGRTWGAGEVILKPTVDRETDGWIAQTTAGLTATEYRVPHPLRTRNGQWTYNGWCAWSRLSGEHGSGGRWRDILGIARALHQDLQPITPPPFLQRRQDPWALADRVAWGLPYQPSHAALGRLLARCATVRRSEGLVDQLIHGDLYGNVLFAEGQLPAVIDLSPYWRPASYALAIAAVDAIAWYSASTQIIDDLTDIDDLSSLLARAAIFRLATADMLATEQRIAQEPRYVQNTAEEFRSVVDLIESLPGARPYSPDS